MRTLASFSVLVLLSAPSFALDVSFAGQRPDALNGRELTIATGAQPWEPVVFEFPDAATAVARAIKDDEEPSAQHPFYRFEWLSKDKGSARFFPMTPSAEIDRLRKLNDSTTAGSEGKVLENSVVMAYINKGAVVRTCMSNDQEVPETITLYVTLNPGQTQASAVIVPEGRVAECVLTATERGAYPALKAPITARMRIVLTR